MYVLQPFDDLKKQLHCLTIDLAEARKEAIEQARINKENVKKLIHLLGVAYKERDEARNQLNKLLMVKLHTLPPHPLPSTTTTTTTTNLPTKQEQPSINPAIGPIWTDTITINFNSNQKFALPTQPPPYMNPMNAHAWIDSNISNLTSNQMTALSTHHQQQQHNMNTTLKLSPNETNNLPTMSPKSPLMMINSNINISTSMANSGMTNHSNVTTTSSSIDSFFDVGSSPGNSDNLNCASSDYDPTCTILDRLAKGRSRPEKGKLLQSVMDAGPLLDSLLMAGSLPKWTNPPQVAYAQQVPPVPISMNKRPRYNDIW